MPVAHVRHPYCSRRCGPGGAPVADASAPDPFQSHSGARARSVPDSVVVGVDADVDHGCVLGEEDRIARRAMTASDVVGVFVLLPGTARQPLAGLPEGGERKVGAVQALAYYTETCI